MRKRVPTQNQATSKALTFKIAIKAKKKLTKEIYLYECSQFKPIVHV